MQNGAERMVEMNSEKRTGLSVLTSVFFALAAVLILGTGCTNHTSQSQISIALPESTKAMAAAVGSTTVLQHVRIQVTGSGLDTPLTYNWDASAATPTIQAAQFSVPTSTALLIQVLAAYQDPTDTSGNLYFDYGDVTQAISVGGDVGVQLAPLNPASTRNGAIAGRYLRADGTAPTGSVLITYPIAGKPSMFIAAQEIFGGWFKFLSIEGVPFNYTLADTGEVLLANASFDSASLLAVDDASTTFNESERTALVTLPTYFQPSSASTYSSKVAQSTLLGYFGPGAGSRMICYPTSGASLSNTATTNNPITAVNLTWGANGTPSTTQGYVVSGGVRADMATACNVTALQYTDHVLVNAAALANQDQFIGYKGPFQFIGTTSPAAVLASNYSISSGIATVSLNWQLLPNVIKDVLVPGGLEGINIYKREGVASATSGLQDYELPNGIACGALESFGFVKVASQALVVGTTSGSVTIPTINPLNYQSGKFQAVICPYRNVAGVPAYFQSGVDYRSLVDAGVSYRFARADGSVLDSQAVGECIPYKAYLVDSSGNQTVATTSTSLEVISSFTGGSAYSDSACATAIAQTSSSSGNGTVIAPSVIAAGAEASSAVYIKGTSPIRAEVGVYDQTSFNTVGNIAIRSTAVPAAYGLAFNDSASNLVVGNCYPIYFGYVAAATATDFSVPYTMSQDEQFTISPNIAGGFYSNANCSTVVSQPFTVGAGLVGRQLYYSPTISSSTSGQFIVVNGTTNNAQTLAFQSGFEVGSAVAHSYNLSASATVLSTSGAYGYGECKPLTIRALNENGATIYSASVKTVTLSSANASFYSDFACGSSTTTTTIPAYNYTGLVYMKSTAGAVSVTGYDSANVILPATSFVLDAPVTAQLMHASGTSLTSVMKNYCYTLTATMLTSSSTPYSGAAYNLAFATSGGSSPVLYNDVNCATVSANQSVVVPAGSSAVNFYVKFATSGSTVPVTLISSRAANLPILSTSLAFVDADHIGASYANSGGGSGVLTLQMYNTSNVALTNLPDPVSYQLTLGGTFTANGSPAATVTLSASTGAGSVSVSGGTATANVTAIPTSTSFWQGSLSGLSGLLIY